MDFKNQDWRDVLHTTTADIRTFTSLLRQRNQGPCFLLESVVRFLLLIMAVLDLVRSLALSSKHLCVIPLHLNHRILTV
jgi:hypothetical protein